MPSLPFFALQNIRRRRAADRTKKIIDRTQVFFSQHFSQKTMTGISSIIEPRTFERSSLTGDFPRKKQRVLDDARKPSEFQIKRFDPRAVVFCELSVAISIILIAIESSCIFSFNIYHLAFKRYYSDKC